MNTPKCVDCCKTRVRAKWDKCLEAGLDVSGACLQRSKVPTNSVLQPNPPHHSHKFRHAQIVKQPGNTVYGRWRRVKFNKKTKQYSMLNGRKSC